MDCNVLVLADEYAHEQYGNAVDLLGRIRQRVEIAIVDSHGRELSNQYDRNIKKPGFAAVWLSQMRPRTSFHDSRVHRRVDLSLDRVGFSRRDRFIVGLALAAGCPIITLDDDFLDPTRRAHLEGPLALTIWTPSDALVELG